MRIYEPQSHDAWLEQQYEARFETGDDFAQAEEAGVIDAAAEESQWIDDRMYRNAI